MTKPRSRLLLISTWYRPPDLPIHHFENFGEIIEKVDRTNNDYFLLGDIIVYLTLGVMSVNAAKLNDIVEVFGLSQLIVDPTRTTSYSSTLIHICVTNAPSKIVNSGTIEFSISDHVLVYMMQGPLQTNRLTDSYVKKHEKFCNLIAMEWQEV